MERTSDPSTLWLSIAREAFAPERSAAEVADTLERLGRQRGLGGGFALGLRELVSYASAVPDPAQGALDAELEAVAVARRIVRPEFRARLQAAIDALEGRLRGKCTCSGCGKVMQSWPSSFGRKMLCSRARRRRWHTWSWTGWCPSRARNLVTSS